ncbi:MULTISPECIES: DUF1194 domain-containing protein [Sulfitobacter]|uniref:VWFA domain-containing protein n=1 Tax=Sulfitobacter dubius TaxID=218673 RepID=A0ABY3ZI22_9RHOB|nr:DUF1194 domain-containing protein [Sulfitobacter dubius]UOA14148.1 hypothetical protein DSM109990_00947 [Sulfitobacter dubius]WOI30355.1 DUF1194 domain-containing protein [Sulfitobacter dubius]
MVRFCISAALALMLAPMADAQAAPCRLALALALDVSSSVDPEEDRLQRGGLAAALRAPLVARAFFAGDVPVALAAYEWSGEAHQKIVLDWTLIDRPAALMAAADIIETSQRSESGQPTAMGHALRFGATLFDAAPICDAHVIDMAGDGQNNKGFGPQTAYRAVPFAGITVNGLVVNAADFEGELGLIAFYQSQVLHGPGAFMVIASGFVDFERAMRVKLIREVSPPALGGLPSTQGSRG